MANKLRLNIWAPDYVHVSVAPVIMSLILLNPPLLTHCLIRHFWLLSLMLYFLIIPKGEGKIVHTMLINGPSPYSSILIIVKLTVFKGFLQEHIDSLIWFLCWVAHTLAIIKKREFIELSFKLILMINEPWSTNHVPWRYLMC